MEGTCALHKYIHKNICKEHKMPLQCHKDHTKTVNTVIHTKALVYKTQCLHLPKNISEGD